MASILKVDKIRGTGLDSDSLSIDGSGNISTIKTFSAPGHILQIVHAGNNTTLASNATNTWFKYLEATITPSSSTSKIFLQHTVWYGGNSNGYGAGRVTRTISGGSEVDLRYGNAGLTDTRFTDASFPMPVYASEHYKIYNANFTFEDTPSTTTAITYKCYVKEDGAGTDMVINRSYSNPGDGYNAPCGTTIQLMEIAQ